MRAYFWGNMYLSSIQQGIQAAHCIAEIAMDYANVFQDDADDELPIFDEWALNHKTMILFNGGYQSKLEAIHNVLNKSEYPCGSFHEEEDSLNGALTCVGIILPEKVYYMAKELQTKKTTTHALLAGHDSEIYIYRDLSTDELIEAEFTANDSALAILVSQSKLAN